MRHMQWVLIFAGPVSRAARFDGFLRTLGWHAGPEDIDFYLFQEMSAVIHGRIADLMDIIATLHGTHRSAWLDEYTDYRLGAELGCWDAECEYGGRFQARLLDATQDFKKGDALPALDDLRPHF